MRGRCGIVLVALALVCAFPGPAQAQDGLAAEESLSRFDELLRRRPFHESAFDALVRHYVEQGKLTDLVASYEARVEALPEEQALRVILARLLIRSGDADRAAEVLEDVDSSELGRDEVKLLVLWSRVEGARGDLDRGLALIEVAIEKAQTIAEQLELSEALADLHLRNNDREAAAAALLAAMERLPADYLHAKRIADALVQRGLDEAAITAYADILPLVAGRTDRRVEVLRQLGMAHERLTSVESALQAYVEAIDLLAEDHWLQRELSERIVSLYRASGKLDELEAYCRGRIERSPSQVSPRVLLAEVQEAGGDSAGARHTLESAVELFPSDQILSERLIALLERADAIDAALVEHERIIAQRPRDPELYIAYGQFLIRHEQVEAARRQWRHVLESEVGDASMALRLASLFEPREMYDDAVTCYERAISLAPDEAQAYLSLSRLWLLRDDEAKARQTLDRLASANPDDASLHAERANGLQSLGDLEAALAAISQASSLDPTNIRYLNDQALLLTRLGRAEEALLVRRETLNIMTNPVAQARAIAGLVSMHADSGRLEAFETAELQMLEAAPGNTVSMFILATIADQQRDFPKSRQWLERLLSSQPRHEAARRQIARISEATGDIDAAVEAYRTLIEQHPGRARQYYQAIVDARLRHNDRYAAVQTLEELVAGNPDNVTVLDSVAEQMARMDETERAMELYEVALRLQPDRHETRLAYGEVLIENGQIDDSVEQFRAAAIQTVDRETSARALSRLHEAAGQLGRLEELLDDLERQVEANPDRTLIAAVAAQLLVEEYEYARAIELLDLVLRANPRDVNMHMARAALLRRLAKFDEAIETYQRVLRFPQADRDYALGELGKAAYEAGRVEQARRVWRQIDHKQYAGTLLSTHSLLDDAVDVLWDGIRFKPDDVGLHRALIKALETAGREDEALSVSRRLLDLQPDNAQFVQELATKHLQRNDRARAAEIAGRLFSASVERSSQQTSQTPGWQSYTSMWSMYGALYGQAGQSKLDLAVMFFLENGLLAELKEVLSAQLAAQPDNALLHRKAVDLYAEQLGDPRRSMELLERLRTMEFPLEHQVWLGQSSQHDYMRALSYQLVAFRPALRDERLVSLEAEETHSHEQKVELAMIRLGQGDTDAAIGLLTEVYQAHPDDLLAGSALAESLLGLERYDEATLIVETLVEQLDARQQAMLEETIERVRRDYVRSLPLPLQARIDEPMRREIARTLLRGQALMASWSMTGQLMGAYRARLALAQIYAETDRIEKAREIWRELAPTAAADADGWATLASAVQEYEQDDLAFEFYRKALEASRAMSGDPLLQRVYGGSQQMRWWYDEQEGIDTSFNRLLRSFAEHDSLLDLYDFLREQGQTNRADQVARQYDLDNELIAWYRERVDASRAEFIASADGPLASSVPYFAEVCKLAEILDRSGDWDGAKTAYVNYLDDFPNEVGLLTMLSDVAEAQVQLDEAITWQKEAIEANRRLSSQSRAWSLRQLSFQPGIPAVLASRVDTWTWAQRWGFGGWRGAGQLDIADAWLRVARLHLADKNPIAAGDAMTRAMREARGNRAHIASSTLSMIRERQLVDEMLPVLRTLAVREPTNEQAQIAFAESLEAAGRSDVAIEVYRRLLRRGVSDLGTLTMVRGRLAALAPEDESLQGETLESLESIVEANPSDAGEKLRLAKAYYYSLRPHDALAMLDDVQRLAPHLDDAVDLRIEIYTLLNDRERLVEVLRDRVAKAGDDQRRLARQALVRQLLLNGDTDEAIGELKQLVDPADPSSYQRIGVMLHYFGRHEEAVEQFEMAASNRQGGQMMFMMGDQGGGASIARAYALKGDNQAALDKIFDVLDDNAQQTAAMGGVYAMFGGGEESQIEPFVSLFVLDAAIGEGFEQRLIERRERDARDLAASKLLIDLYRRSGRPEMAQVLLDELAGSGEGDQELVQMLIDRAIATEDFDRAIELATAFIDRHPKPVIPAGLPAEYAAMMSLMSPRNAMICKLGDVYWHKGDADLAFETYAQIIDEKVDASRLAYANICLIRDRVDEARAIVDESLASQEIRSPQLLQFRALIAAIDDDADLVFDLLAEADRQTTDATGMMSYMGGGDAGSLLTSVAQSTGRIDRYVEHARAKIDDAPGDWNLRQSLANTQKLAGRFDDAVATLDAAAEHPSMRFQAMSLKNEWLMSFMDDEAKLAATREMINLSEQQVGTADSRFARFGQAGSNSASHRERLGDLLWDLGRHDEAIKTWLERADESITSTHTAHGARMVEREEWARAEAAYRKALELNPANRTAHLQLAQISMRHGDTAAVVDHLIDVYRADNRSGTLRASQRQQAHFDIDMRHALATLIEETGELDSVLADLDPDRAKDARLMLAIWTGQWREADALVAAQLDESPYDPGLWLLRARCKEELGDLSASLEALYAVRRLDQTTLADHHQQLELALAGKQVQEAAAQQPSGMPSGYQQFSGYPGYSPYGSSLDDAALRLASLHIRMGDIEQAERLFLAESEAMAPLSSLADLMRRQGDERRALELMRLALITNADLSTVPQYANLLAQAGHVDRAVDLMTRHYRYASGVGGGMSFFYYGYAGDASELELETSEQSGISRSMNVMLTKASMLDEVLADFQDRLNAAPDDRALLKLTVSLLIRNDRWDQARTLLRSSLDREFVDPAFSASLYQLGIQLRQADEALEALRQLEDVLSERDVARRRTLAHIIGGEPEVAKEVILESIAAVDSDDIRPELLLLVAAGGVEEATEVLQERSEDVDLLVAIAPQGEGWSALIDEAIDRAWSEPVVFSARNRHIVQLAAIVQMSLDAGAQLDIADDVDRALIDLLAGRVDVAIANLDAMHSQRPRDIRVLRVLHLAHDLSGNVAASTAMLESIVNRLDDDRGGVWREASTEPLGERVRTSLRDLSDADMDTETILSMSAGYGASILHQVFSSNSTTPFARLNAELLSPHVVALQEAHARAGDAEALAAAIDMPIESQQDFDYRYFYQMQAQHMYGLQSYYRNSSGGTSLEGLLHDAGRYDEYLDHVERDLLLETSQWHDASRALAALGRTDEAKLFQERAARSSWSTLRGVERPFADEHSRYWWSYNNEAEQELNTIAGELDRVFIDVDPTDSPITGEANEPWEIALLNANLAEQFVDVQATIGAGWGNTSTLRQALSLLWSHEDYDELLTVLERVFELEVIARGQYLSWYLIAAARSQDHARFEQMLVRVAGTGEALADDVELLRLCHLRSKGDDAAADALEASLIASCKAPVADWLIDDSALRQRLMTAPTFWQQPRLVGRRWQQTIQASAAVDVTSLASAIDVDISASVSHDDMSLSRIRDAYARFALFEDAIRIADLQTETEPEWAKAGVTEQKCRWLHRLGRRDEAIALARAIVEERAADPTPDEFGGIVRFAGSRRGADDPEWALDLLRTYKSRDVLLDTDNLTEARLLARAGRPEEAWKAYQTALNSGRIPYHDVDVLYQAGLAAAAVEERTAARRLLNTALWHDPTHHLSDQAREALE